MLILALDTATEICGVALACDERVTAQISLSGGLTHTTVLMKAIDSVLDLAGLSIGQVDAFIVNRGPGSFTGLRIGISTAKGLAVATGKPLVGISSLQILAHQSPEGTDLVCPMIDAHRRQVYWALYLRQGADLMLKVDEQVGSPADVAAYIQSSCTFIGNGARLYAGSLFDQLQVPARWAPEGLNDVNPGVLARLGQRRLVEGQFDDATHFTPVYLRKSDAKRI